MRTSHTTVVRQVDIEEAVASAEVQFQKGEWNEDLLLMVSHALHGEAEGRRRKIIAYSLKLLEMLETKAKPEEISDAEWDIKKRNMVGHGELDGGLVIQYTGKVRRGGQALACRRCRTSATPTCSPEPITTSDT